MIDRFYEWYLNNCPPQVADDREMDFELARAGWDAGVSQFLEDLEQLTAEDWLNISTIRAVAKYLKTREK